MGGGCVTTLASSLFLLLDCWRFPLPTSIEKYICARRRLCGLVWLVVTQEKQHCIDLFRNLSLWILFWLGGETEQEIFGRLGIGLLHHPNHNQPNPTASAVFEKGKREAESWLNYSVNTYLCSFLSVMGFRGKSVGWLGTGQG